MAPRSCLQHRGPGQNIPSVWHKLAEVSVVCSDHNHFVEVNCETPVCKFDLAGAHESLSLQISLCFDGERRQRFWDGGGAVD